MRPRLLSPNSLNQFLGCEHRTYLDVLDARGVLGAERLPPNAQLLLERGERHEEAFPQRLRDEGRDTVSLPRTGPVTDRYAATAQEMRAGRQVIHQACLLDDGWVGYADFLIRVDERSDLGNFSYEVHEAKLGSHPRPGHIFQLLFYNDRLAELQGLRPTRVHLVLGNDERPAFAPDEFDAYAARVRERFLQRRAELDGPQPAPVYPYPVPDCEFCPWWKHCADRRRDEDHLSLVAGLQRSQGLKLEEEGVHTVAGLAGVPALQIVPRLHAATLEGLRAQANLQVRSRGLVVPLYELLKPAHDRGVARLPEPSDGDVFFDFEGDPFWGDDGLEYLFGTVSLQDGEWRYRRLWATSRAEEKRQFETWMDWISARLSEHPDLHIFHYNSYEPTAIKKLMSRHATRAHEVDELLRRKVFVDLYGVVRQAMRVGIESYGLKSLEPVFGFSRDAELREATGSLRRWQEFGQTGEQRFLNEIAGYNEEDCRSTATLRNWLMERRGEAEAQFDIELGALHPEPEREPSDRAQRYRARVERARGLLMPGLPDDESEDDAEQRARRIAFDLIGYHEREAKPAWWAHFGRSCCSRGSCETSQRSAHRFPADTALDGGVFLPDERSSASGQEKYLLSGRLRTRNLDRDPAKRSRAVQDGPPGPSAASRAAAPLDGPEKRSYEVPFEYPPRRALQSRNASNYCYLGCFMGVHRPTGTAGAPQKERSIAEKPPLGAPA